MALVWPLGAAASDWALWSLTPHGPQLQSQEPPEEQPLTSRIILRVPLEKVTHGCAVAGVCSRLTVTVLRAQQKGNCLEALSEEKAGREGSVTRGPGKADWCASGSAHLSRPGHFHNLVTLWALVISVLTSMQG